VAANVAAIGAEARLVAVIGSDAGAIRCAASWRSIA
jgi:bifunctional ADP-heptose synthase (sugar kinase/adenylyltransferase)